MRKWIVVAQVILLGSVVEARAACQHPDLKIVEHLKDKIAVYSESGKFQREISKSEVPIGTAVIDCNEARGLGLVKIGAPVTSVVAPAAKPPGAQLTATAPGAAPPAETLLWIDLSDVNTSIKVQPPCVSAPSSSPAERSYASAGVSSANCKPITPAPRKAGQ